MRFCVQACAVSGIAFSENIFFEFAFCSVVLHLFLHKKLRNDWRWFCACINYCILWCVITCGVRIFLLICMLVDLVFIIICTIAFSPYFLQNFCALLSWFWDPIPHFCVFCCMHVCLGITSWSCAIIIYHIFLLVVFWDSYVHTFVKWNLFCGDRQGFVDFVDLVSVCLFWL